MRTIILAKFFDKKHGFTLAEILVVLGLIGTISAITIPNLAYNYRAKVLEEQYRSTYSEIKEIGSYINYDKGDVGIYANKTDFGTWQSEFMSKINGGNRLGENAGVYNIVRQLMDFYKQGGGSPGPYHFNLGANNQPEHVGTAASNYLCDNGQLWIDSKGRIWTFNLENRIICVDINGSANPNRYNIDIFAFAPMSAEMVAIWVYDDPDNVDNYSGQIVPCDIDKMHRNGLGNGIPNKDAGTFRRGGGSALDYCPFFEPMENVAAINSSRPGKSARNRDVTRANNYWKDYINYK